MTQVIISLYDGAAPICLPVDEHNNTLEQIKHSVYNITSIPIQDQVLNSMGGSMLMDDDALDLQHPVHFLNLSGRLLGGKGGFGSMLRAQGGRMNAQKTTNFEACRDLQGRRIKTVNDAKKLQEELDALPEREAEKREKLKRKIEDALKEREPRKYLFDDNEFLEDKEEMVENVKSAVGSAIKRQKVTHKPVASSSASMFDDDVSSDEDEEEEEGEGEEDEEEEEEQVASVKEEKQAPEKEKTTKAKGKGKAKA